MNFRFCWRYELSLFFFCPLRTALPQTTAVAVPFGGGGVGADAAGQCTGMRRGQGPGNCVLVKQRGGGEAPPAGALGWTWAMGLGRIACAEAFALGGSGHWVRPWKAALCCSSDVSVSEPRGVVSASDK